MEAYASSRVPSRLIASVSSIWRGTKERTFELNRTNTGMSQPTAAGIWTIRVTWIRSAVPDRPRASAARASATPSLSADRLTQDDRRLVDDTAPEPGLATHHGLQRHDRAGGVADDDDRLGEVRRQGEQVVDLAREVGGRVWRQLGAVEPPTNPHHAEAWRQLRGHLGPGGLVAEPAVDDQDDRTAALVRIDDAGRVVGGEVLQHAGHATDAAHPVRRMAGWPSPSACSSTAEPTGWSGSCGSDWRPRGCPRC